MNVGMPDLNVLSEPRRVVVPCGLGVSEGLEDRIGGKDLALHLTRFVQRVFELCSVSSIGWVDRS